MENIMIYEKKPILIDFGFSAIFNSIPENQVFGSMGYMSPELLKGQKFDPLKNDVWAFGILAHKLYTNKFPFLGANFEEIQKKIATTPKLNLTRIDNNYIKTLI